MTDSQTPLPPPNVADQQQTTSSPLAVTQSLTGPPGQLAEPVKLIRPDQLAPPEKPAEPLLRSELLDYAEVLGLDVHRRIKDEELAEVVEQRVRLIEALPRDRLVEVLAWAHIAVPPNADKIALARRISQMEHTKFPGLDTPSLRAAALLRGCAIEPDDSREAIQRKIRAKEGLLAKLRRKRRAFVGKLIAGMIGDVPDHTLPEEQRPLSLRERIEQEGIVSGLTGKLRGAADEYIHQKLDEIEARIDQKLSEIDHHLAEWRDKEIANRVRIIRITLVASILVALLSLAYTYVRVHFPWLMLP